MRGCVFVVLFMLGSLLCERVDAADEAKDLDLFLGVGAITEHPYSSDGEPSGVISFGAGYRPNPRFAVGLEGFIHSWNYPDILLLSAYGKFYLLPYKVFNPYARAGLGFLNVPIESSSQETLMELIPQWALGFELGFKFVAFYAELTGRYNYTLGPEKQSTLAVLAGVSGHIPLGD